MSLKRKQSVREREDWSPGPVLFTFCRREREKNMPSKNEEQHLKAGGIYRVYHVPSFLSFCLNLFLPPTSFDETDDSKKVMLEKQNRK